MKDIIPQKKASIYDDFLNGTDMHIYRHLGAHLREINGVSGAEFAVWAPHARQAAVICDRTGWERNILPLHCENSIWRGFVPGIGNGDRYRYIITGADGVRRYKSDPLAFRSELRPASASVVCDDSSFVWTDGDFIANHDSKHVYDRPLAVYELHLGSWKRDRQTGGFLDYRRLADELGEYIAYMGFTHIELIGICEYPFDGSWGYQVTGYFSPTCRYGTPDGLRYLINSLHKHGIGVILDWVPAHFPLDEHGLAYFDGSTLYEPDEPLLRDYPQWGTHAFDYAKPEVRSFLLSSACFWIEEFHIDALRVDAVAAMLYRSFGRSEWRPNAQGGSEHPEGIDFLRELNTRLLSETRGWLIAEDSSIMSGITAPPQQGGLGFLLKWSLGWMNDTLKYLSCDPLFRKWQHDELTHTADYAFTEHFLLPLSHDEVVHLKHSLLNKLPGYKNDRLQELKALYTLQLTFPGKKLLFMGQEFAEEREWDENREIDWPLADRAEHREVMQCLRRLLELYRRCPALHRDELSGRSFEWIKRDDRERNILCYLRRDITDANADELLTVINFSPVAYPMYSCGIPYAGECRLLFSSRLRGGNGADEDPIRDTVIAPIQTENHLCDGLYHRLCYPLGAYEATIFELHRQNE